MLFSSQTWLGGDESSEQRRVGKRQRRRAIVESRRQCVINARRCGTRQRWAQSKRGLGPSVERRQARCVSLRTRAVDLRVHCCVVAASICLRVLLLLLLPGSGGRREEEGADEALFYNTRIAPIIDEMTTHIKGNCRVRVRAASLHHTISAYTC